MTHTCDIDLNNLFNVLRNPGADPNFLNPNPVIDPNVIYAFVIKIYLDGVAYDFSTFYVSKSMRINSIFGGKGSFSFTLADDDPDQVIVHFIPVEEMYVEIEDLDGNLWANGYIKEVIPRLIGSQGLSVRSDLTEARNYEIVCNDLFNELELRPVSEFYQNKTLGFILRDVITRYTTLDASEIDPNLGFEIPTYPINAKMPSQVLIHIMQLTGTTYFIDGTTRKIYVTEKNSSEVRFPVTITDDIVYDYFDYKTFELRRQTDNIYTAIELWYTEKYERGTVNVANTSDIVAGFGATPLTDWEDRDFEGGKFKLKSETDTYSIEKNLSVGLTQEIRLTSAYKGGTSSDNEYEITGRRVPIRAYNLEALALRKRIRQDDGLAVQVVSQDSNALTHEEARKFAAALLELSTPLPKGRGITNTMNFQFQPIHAGMVLNFNLPKSHKFLGEVVIQEVRIQDIAGEVNEDQHSEGKIRPDCQIEFVWTAQFNSIQAQMRKMIQDLKKVEVKLDTDDQDIRAYYMIPETMYWQDCIHEHLPEEITEDMTFTEEIRTRIVSDEPLYYTEYSYTHGINDYSFSSD